VLSNDRYQTDTKRLIKRKSHLKKILPKGHNRIRFKDHVLEDGERLFKQIEKMGLEGMIAKRIDSLYAGARTRALLKVKTVAAPDFCWAADSCLCVVCSVSRPQWF
jgi:bifunctional non-homologous end joining protein LigD